MVGTLFKNKVPIYYRDPSQKSRPDTTKAAYLLLLPVLLLVLLVLLVLLLLLLLLLLLGNPKRGQACPFKESTQANHVKICLS